MPPCQAALVIGGECVAERRVDLLERQQSRDFAFGFGEPLAQFAGANVKRITQFGEGIGKFQRFQVGPLPVLADLLDEDLHARQRRLGRRHVFHEAGDRGQANRLRRAVATFARNDLIHLRFRFVPHADRLPDTAFPNRCGEVRQLLFIKLPPWLVGVGLDPVEVDQEGPSETLSSLLGGIDRRETLKRQ